jgi:electron transfer flavoprotein alpha subunit
VESAGAVVAAGTDRGNEVLAHLGALTGLPMAANCVFAHHVAPGEYRLARQRWAGLLLEDATLTAPAALLTVATDAIDAASADAGAADTGFRDADSADATPAGAGGAEAGPGAGAAEPGTPGAGSPGDLPVRAYEPELAEGDLAVRATESATQAGGASLATARVVVGGGRGVGGAEGFAPLEELAALLGGVVGVSRVVTSEGWRPHRQQVGQTGTRITPEVYLACGISGAIQHMAGCAGAKHIIAVNTDPGAPIISHADYAVLGDLKEVIPALIAAIRARAAQA